jgi:toluene monooxygenase system ferredoxin subunit
MTIEPSVKVDWIRAATLEDLWEGEILDLEIGSDSVLLVHHLGGPIRAFQAICPHQETLLADGKWDEETGVLTCGAHNWQFDMRTGDGINPSRCRLYAYEVRMEGDDVFVGIPRDGRRHYNRCTAAGEV